MSILLPVGKVSKAFGLDGEALINLYDTFPDDINHEEPLFVNADGLAVPLFLEHFERRGRRGALVRFADIDSPARVQEFIGMELSLRQVAGPAETTGGFERDGEIFFEDLVGFRATISESGANAANAVHGEVTAFIDSEMNPLLQIGSQGREILIPAADEFIESVDTAHRRITFTIPEGLLDLY